MQQTTYRFPAQTRRQRRHYVVNQYVVDPTCHRRKRIYELRRAYMSKGKSCFHALIRDVSKLGHHERNRGPYAFLFSYPSH
jgi:hypothetical protein